MGRNSKNNVHTRIASRFGSPLRMEITQVRVKPANMNDYHQKFFEAYKAMCRSFLKREPTEDELFGRVDFRTIQPSEEEARHEMV
jgi:hypothetical protein